MKDLSVIICAHNPRRDMLARVLSALDAQGLPKGKWELLLIDNASERPLADAWDLSWHPRARHIREDELGLTPARIRGIRESCGDLLVYVDDDNVLAPDYLQTALALFRQHPFLGTIGAGTLDPEFAAPPAPDLLPFLGLLALRRVAAASWSNNPGDYASVPWGAGLCVARHVAEHYPQLLKQLGVDELLDRRGTALFGDGDTTFSWSSVVNGRGFGVFPELRVTHMIPAHRTTPEYILRLVRDSSFSGGVLTYLRTGEPPGNGYASGERHLRLLLRGMRKGLFTMRVGYAECRGLEQARTYIEQQDLKPLILLDRG